MESNRYYIVSLLVVAVVAILTLLAVLDFISTGKDIPVELWAILTGSLGFVSGLHIPFNNKKE